MVKTLTLLALLMPGVVNATLRFEEGVARDPGSQAVLYREQHWVRMDGDRPIERLVLYLCPDGTAFGRKRVDYGKSSTAPAFRLDDSRSGYVEGLREAGVPEVFVRDSTGEREQSATLSADHLVADAGFDEFVRAHWQALLAGQAVPMDFALPSRLESIGFAVRRVGDTVVAGEPAWVFRLRLESVIGWLAPHIDVTYGKQSRRLLRFEGLSNLRDTGKHQLTARIDFPHPAQPVDAGQWQQALDARLMSCTIGR